jgi:hypothetical protein
VSTDSLAQECDTLFAEGKDMLFGDTPWRIPLISLYYLHKSIYNLLVSQKLISSTLHQDIGHLLTSCSLMRRETTIIGRITDTFLVDFHSAMVRLYTLQQEEIKLWRWGYPFLVRPAALLNPLSKNAYSGEHVYFLDSSRS